MPRPRNWANFFKRLIRISPTTGPLTGGCDTFELHHLESAAVTHTVSDPAIQKTTLAHLIWIEPLLIGGGDVPRHAVQVYIRVNLHGAPVVRPLFEQAGGTAHR